MNTAETVKRPIYDRARTEYSYAEIAKELGCSVSRVQQLENNALTKCLFWCQDHGYRIDDLLERK